MFDQWLNNPVLWSNTRCFQYETIPCRKATGRLTARPAESEHPAAESKHPAAESNYLQKQQRCENRLIDDQKWNDTSYFLLLFFESSREWDSEKE
jgi:hypothetical protein